MTRPCEFCLDYCGEMCPDSRIEREEQYESDVDTGRFDEWDEAS